MASVLYFDCFSGVSGDMLLGALLDAGMPLEELRRGLGGLGLGGCDLDVERVDRAGVSATKIRVRSLARPDHAEATDVHDHDATDAHRHGHGNASHHHASRDEHHSLAEIGAFIDRSSLSPGAKSKAKELFGRLAAVEADIHQVPLERVHLHEVGALDSIIDIVGAVHALEWFGADRIAASPLNVGGGEVQCAHGLFPVPAPATARLLEGVPVYSTGAEGELVTPTGALLVAAYASAFGPLPAMRIERIGYGAGDRNPTHRPNVLRVLMGVSSDAGPVEPVVVMECEIDDMNPQIFGVVMDRLYEAGALDVFYVPVQMKKNRPGTLLTIVARPERREPLLQIVFRETTSLGIRYQEIVRERLDREIVTVDSSVGPIRVKVGRRAGVVMNVAPEFEDCARIAASRGLSVKEVQALAMKAYLDAGPTRP